MCDSCFLAIANLLLSKRERQSENPAAQPGQAKPSSIKKKSQPASFLLAKNYPLAGHSPCPPARALTLISLTAGPFFLGPLGVSSHNRKTRFLGLGVSVGRRNSRGASQGGVSTPVHKKMFQFGEHLQNSAAPSRNLLRWFWDCAARRLQDTR